MRVNNKTNSRTAHNGLDILTYYVHIKKSFLFFFLNTFDHEIIYRKRSIYQDFTHWHRTILFNLYSLMQYNRIITDNRI